MSISFKQLCKLLRKNALIVANTGRFIALFELDNIRILQSLGYEVHCFANFQEEGYESLLKIFENLGIIKHEVSLIRSPYNLSNIKIYKELKTLIKREKFNFIDCHTPMGGVLARLAARATNTKPVMYTAHGFHFFKGAPILNWLIYYPVERFLSRFTDTLITINHEDYERAKKFHAGNVKLIPGVGFDTNKFMLTNVNYVEKRKELGIPENAFVVLSVGELIPRKNHETIIKAIYELQNKNIYYLICGESKLKNYLNELISNLNLQKQIYLKGFRVDINEIVQICDCFAFPSKREGLGIAALEAMAAGIPIVTSNLNGIIEYSENGKTGFACDPNDVTAFSNAINKLIQNESLMKQMGAYNRKAVKKFDIKNVNRIMAEIYKNILIN